MRRMIVQIPSSDYAAGVGLRLYGPDDAGAIDTAAPVQSGRRLVHGPGEAHRWGEAAWGSAPRGNPRRWAGWGQPAWGRGPWGHETEPVWLVSEAVEDGVQEVGMQAFDVAGDSSLSVNVGAAFVVSAPNRPKDLSASVAGSQVTVAFG